MSETIFSLIGVLIGGLITFISTYFFEWKNRKFEKKQKEKELICNVIKQYEILSNKIYFNTYYHEDPNDIIQYISEEFMEMRYANRNKELLFIERDILNSIEKVDNILHSFDEPYDGEELFRIKNSIKECIAILKDYII